MALGKQAKILSDRQQAAVLNLIQSTRYPYRNRVIFLLSMKAGLRAKEIACLQWRHVLDVEGNLADHLSIENSGSKGKNGGRTIPMHPGLADALRALQRDQARDGYIVRTERNTNGVTPQVIVNMFQDWYRALGFEGASSHSGRRTFVTRAAKAAVGAGGSLRDVQQFGGLFGSDAQSARRR